MTYNIRIKERRQELGLTQVALAERCGWKKSRIANYESNLDNDWHREPSLMDFEKIATALETTPQWIQMGIGDNQKPEQKTMADVYASIPDGMAPIIEWTEVRRWVEHSKAPPPKKNWQYERSPKPGNKKIFALRIQNDAMMSKSKSFAPGGIIFVDPTQVPLPGKYVIVIKADAGEAIFRQYVKDGDKTYLKTLNPEYPLLTEFDKTYKICGKVIRYLDDDLD